MKTWYKNILITWEPWCGKSTLLKELISKIDNKSWFLTEQNLNTDWNREWFEILDSKWNKYPLASKNTPSDILFANKYYIQSKWLQEIIKNFSYNIWDLIYIDEIAQMQLYAPWFEDFALDLLNTKNPLVWITKLDDSNYPIIQQIKNRKDTLIINLSKIWSRDFLLWFIKKVIKSQKYIFESDRYTKISNNHYQMKSSSNIRDIYISENWIISCNCDFYNNHWICSHTMALRQII